MISAGASRMLGGESVSLADMLRARDERSARLSSLSTCARSIISITLNIPGSVKTPRLSRSALACAVSELCRALPESEILCEVHERTGHEAVIGADSPPEDAKRTAVEIEETHPLGRLFDIDVIAPSGERASRTGLGAPPRKCFVCGGDAHGCARARAHPLDELTASVESALSAHFRGAGSDAVSRICLRALLYEAAATPKPGLVDRHDSGSHGDMDLFTYIDSSVAIAHKFGAMFAAGWAAPEGGAELLRRLQRIGLDAEQGMLSATGGVNTHRGAIFSLGIFCAALGRTWWTEIETSSEADVRDECAVLGREALRGHDASLRGGAGARGEAASGFASAFEIALPSLERSARMGESANDAGVRALLAMIAHVEDTNMISRGGRELALCAMKSAHRAAAADDLIAAARELNESFSESRLSPGGCADMLALGYAALWTLRGQNLLTSSQTAMTRAMSLNRDST